MQHPPALQFPAIEPERDIQARLQPELGVTCVFGLEFTSQETALPGILPAQHRADGERVARSAHAPPDRRLAFGGRPSLPRLERPLRQREEIRQDLWLLGGGDVAIQHQPIHQPTTISPMAYRFRPRKKGGRQQQQDQPERLKPAPRKLVQQAVGHGKDEIGRLTRFEWIRSTSATRPQQRSHLVSGSLVLLPGEPVLRTAAALGLLPAIPTRKPACVPVGMDRESDLLTGRMI